MTPRDGSIHRHEGALALLQPRPWVQNHEVTITVDLDEDDWDTTEDDATHQRRHLPDALHGMYYLG